MNEQIFDKIKAELQQYNIAWVSGNSGVAQSTLYHWLEGRTKKPRLDTIVRVAKVIGFDVKLIKVKQLLKAA